MENLELIGLEQINKTEEENTNGGRLYPWDNDITIVCCWNIPPSNINSSQLQSL